MNPWIGGWELDEGNCALVQSSQNVLEEVISWTSWTIDYFMFDSNGSFPKDYMTLYLWDMCRLLSVNEVDIGHNLNFCSVCWTNTFTGIFLGQSLRKVRGVPLKLCVGPSQHFHFVFETCLPERECFICQILRVDNWMIRCLSWSRVWDLFSDYRVQSLRNKFLGVYKNCIPPFYTLRGGHLRIGHKNYFEFVCCYASYKCNGIL